jgi:methyl-accepting chemotaxis protein
MLIKTKLQIGSILLGLIPAVVATTLVGLKALESAESELRVQAEARLTSLREEKYQQLSRYFEVLNNQVVSVAQSHGTVRALNYMGSFFSMSVATPDEEAALKGFYGESFTERYATQNGGEGPPIEDILASLGKDSIGLQTAYILKNPFEFDDRYKLADAEDGSGYNNMHKKYHATFMEMKEKLDFQGTSI